MKIETDKYPQIRWSTPAKFHITNIRPKSKMCFSDEMAQLIYFCTHFIRLLIWTERKTQYFVQFYVERPNKTNKNILFRVYFAWMSIKCWGLAPISGQFLFCIKIILFFTICPLVYRIGGRKKFFFLLIYSGRLFWTGAICKIVSLGKFFRMNCPSNFYEKLQKNLNGKTDNCPKRAMFL